MLLSLSIKNYALIDDLKVRFDRGLTIITGETGAGKSILLGGLSLILGKRADLNSLKNKEKKCVIEAEFSVGDYHLQSLFEKLDLDYEPHTIIRREILPSGKSRAFVNDTPVTLDVLSALSLRLIDIHSQHQTLQLTNNDFQFQVIDAIAGNKAFIESYKVKLAEYYKAKKELQALIDFQQEADKEQDYNSFLLKELQEARLEPGMLEELEEAFEKLSNVEEIKEKLAFSSQLLSDEHSGILVNLNVMRNALGKLSGYGPRFEELQNRINSVFIELDDTFNEIENLDETVEANPEELEQVNVRLQLLYDLQKKHNALEVEELIRIQKALEEKVSVTENLENDIKNKQLEVLKLEEELDKLAAGIHGNRVKEGPKLKEYLEGALKKLGMPNATFKIEIRPTTSFFANGKDELHFLFSANKGSGYGELKKVASGGELSRIMLCIKAVLARYEKLPTIMFDEIDTGVSGEVSDKMGDIMQQMGESMQVFAITHLPQIAAKGAKHFKVYKEDSGTMTSTEIKELSTDERIVEIAEMLSGKNISDSAISHARELLLL
ncbi:DNA repair protein RecN [Sinomicrobium weinanense]|uniref:DNA repair protein RecN n=1 Tax=Sinomicrobium weinanense TaxID=2842200 RepID=A0A926JTN2_9FLAO|nr:DNA repair protein RecN [Sinomicrobium weinanense]MBC9796986.1 DNA repair protein RecN [Sinomicrobium weinanense]MBU3122175.1 DNA repair protein RecN [Sinomicrobium weinanense]